MVYYIGAKTKITYDRETEPVRRAVSSLRRDITKACTPEAKKPEIQEIRLVERCEKGEPESYELRVAGDVLTITAGDDLGFVYALFLVSRELLGIADFWFWNDQQITPQDGYPVEDGYVAASEPAAVKYHGWFINDEVLLAAWRVDGSAELPWEMAFEALLRCGGNMVIPGTDRNSKKYAALASDMGLYITHHHAEPLGAEMFARAYPKEDASYEAHPELFEKLWREGIEAQRDRKVVWNLGFRGQGDRPFWKDDPRYQTDEARGELISRLIGIQYEMVRGQDASAVCCTNLYGETMELYRGGYLNLPEDVIKIWADNGYGKMVARRQGNHNPRVSALPEELDLGCHGIYYHVSFYDLQAANHITMLPNPPEFVKEELDEVLRRDMKDFWIINCSNIKPHAYLLDFIAELWRAGYVDVEQHRRAYVETYYGRENSAGVVECLRRYPEYAPQYGVNADDHAGEQFSNYVARMLVYQYRRERTAPMEGLKWATDAATLSEQVEWYAAICGKAQAGYAEYAALCEETAQGLPEVSAALFESSILLQAKVHLHCYTGAVEICKALQEAFAGELQRAFYHAGKARKAYLLADGVLRESEHGKWKGFYANECLTDIKQSAWVAEGLMNELRNLGDGPHFYQWQRDFLYSEEDRRVVLITNMENHLRDEELFVLMEKQWDE